MTLNIFLFGTPRFEQAGKSLHVSRRKSVALVSYLACADRPCSRETLAALFWPEHDQAAALKSLRRELARAKQALGQQMISASRVQLWLNHEADITVDVVQFQDYLQHVRELDQSPETCSQANSPERESAP
jgi:DNA-binding SARP family transcriptional activator